MPLDPNSEKGKTLNDKDFFTKHDIVYNEDPSNWTQGQIDKYFSVLPGKGDSKSGTTWNWHQRILARQDELRAKAAENERWGQMMEYLGGMTQALQDAANAAAKPVPYNEVMKQAASASDAASTETARRQSLRKGLMSTFSTLADTSTLGGSDF